MPQRIFYPSKLDSSKGEIRVLELVDDAKKSESEWRLHTVAFQDSPQFTALSYVWGNPQVTTNITLDGTKTPVTINLASALRHVLGSWRYAFPDRDPASFRIWVDALCINQSDTIERSEQVKLMPQIYSRAELVLGWLGHQDVDEVATAVKTIKTLHTAFESAGDDLEAFYGLAWLDKYPALTEPPECDKNWEALNTLGSLPYWKRVWIWQENILASTMFYLAPNTLIEAEILIDTCFILRGLTDLLAEHHVAKPDFVQSDTWMMLNPPNSVSFHGLTSIQQLSHYTHAHKDSLSNDFNEDQKLMAQLNLSQQGAVLLATDPKDHIYGLLGIDSLNIEVDYSQTKQVRDVYIDYCRTVLEVLHRLPRSELRLFFLEDAGIGHFDNKFDLPSWAPNYPERSVSYPTVSFLRKLNIRTMIPDLPFPRLLGTSLSIGGIRLQTIKSLSPLPPTLENIKKGSDLAAWFEEYIMRRPFSHTLPSLWVLFLVATRMQQLTFNTPNMLLLRAFLLCLGISLPENETERVDLVDCQKTAVEDGVSVAVDMRGSSSKPVIVASISPSLDSQETSQGLWNRVVGSTTSRLFYALQRNRHTKIFETEREHLGMGPRNCSEGDIICLLDGYHGLVLLRKCGEDYQFVGPCMTFGLEETDIRTGLGGGSFTIESFRLV